jgi:hypothetical protein
VPTRHSAPTLVPFVLMPASSNRSCYWRNPATPQHHALGVWSRTATVSSLGHPRICVRIIFMGSNRRYGSDITDAAINEAVIRPRPVSLTAAEIGQQSVTDPPVPEAVTAWVRYPETPIRVEGRAIA